MRAAWSVLTTWIALMPALECTALTPESTLAGSVAKTGVAWEGDYWSFGLGVLGSQAEHAVDELDLGLDSTCLNLPLPDHMHRLVAPQGSPGRWERAEPQTCFDQSFDESMVLLDQVIEVFDWSKLAPLGQLALSL